MNGRFLSLVFVFALFLSPAIIKAQESTPAPTYKDGDTWQVNITRKGAVASSTTQTEGVYELVVAQGKVKVFEINGSQKTEVDVQPDSPAEGLLGVVGKNEKRPDLNFPLSIGKKWTYDVVGRTCGST
jgi:hypothetical protein